MQVSNYLLVDGLAKAGAIIELHVFAGQATTVHDENNVRRFDYSISPKSILNHLQCATAIFRRAEELRPDFVLLLDEGVVRALGFLPFQRKRGIRYVSINSGSTLTRGARHLRGLANAYFVRRGYRWLDLLFVAQSTAAALDDSSGFAASQVRVLGRPVPDDFFAIGAIEECEPMFDNELPTLFCCARAEEEKGVALVLHALAKLRDENGCEVVNFIFAGEGPALSSWRTIVSTLSLYNVHFVGRKSLGELRHYYQSCYMCIFPAHGLIETFGRTWVEAFASGKPLISTDTDNLKYLVHDGVNGIVILPDVADIVKGIRRALSLSKNAYVEMSLRARETALPYKQSTIVSSLLDSLGEIT